MRLEGKVAIITGGANGMGAEECRIFAREGAKVVIADILEDEGRKIEAEIAEAGGEVVFMRLDVTSESDWQATVDATVARYGKLDVLVNNAGIGGSHTREALTAQRWDAFMNINAKGVFLGMLHAIPAMKAAGGGAIVNISSISGIVGQEAVHMGYNASKGAVRTVTKSAAVQYAQDGIRVNSVHPGLMPPMITTALSSDRRDEMTANVPMRRAGRREEVGYAVLFLASDEASYITGAELVVDGGFTAA